MMSDDEEKKVVIEGSPAVFGPAGGARSVQGDRIREQVLKNVASEAHFIKV